LQNNCNDWEYLIILWEKSQNDFKPFRKTKEKEEKNGIESKDVGS